MSNVLKLFSFFIKNKQKLIADNSIVYAMQLRYMLQGILAKKKMFPIPRLRPYSVSFLQMILYEEL